MDWKYLFDDRILSRGQDYYEQALVILFKNRKHGFCARVQGNEIYTGLKNVADHINGAYGIKIKNSGIKGDRYICGETKEGLVILDTGRDCKVIRAYNGYALGTKDEIYKTRVNKRRYILITNKKKTKRAFMWLSQKSGVSEIIA